MLRLTVSAVVVTALVAPTAAAAPDPLQTELDKVVTAGAPAALAEVLGPDRRWNGASGVRDIRTGKPARPQTRFRIGSVSKAMLSTVVLQLVGEGRLKLDDPVQRQLPGLLPYAEPITIRQLLQHTSGLPDFDTKLFTDWDSILAGRQNRYTPRQIVRIATASDPLDFPPGTRWEYSNTNYTVAGLLVEKLTGHSLAQLLHRRVFVPARMFQSSHPFHARHILGPHPRGYLSVEPLTDITVYDQTWAWAAGAVIATPGDVNRFYRALANGTLLSPALLAEMRRPDPIPDGLDYGLGVFTASVPCVPGGKVWGHDGATFGYLTLSLHSLDATRQVTVGATLYYSQAVGQAQTSFAITALCGTVDTARAAQRLPSTLDKRLFG